MATNERPVKRNLVHWGALTLLSCSLAMASPSHLRASVLSDLVASMPAGTWAELQPANRSVIQNLQNIAVYADSAVWDPVSRRFLFCGSYHASPLRCVAYSEANNSWSTFSVPYTYITYHAYDHSTLDPVRGIYYFREQSTRNVYKYTVASNSWSAVPSLPNQFPTCCGSLVYFPDYNGGGLLYLNNTFDGLYFLPDGASQWQAVPNSKNMLGTNDSTWHFGEYNPVHKVVVFGNANGSKMFKMSATGQITALNNIPITLYDGAPGQFTVDPVTGEYLALTPTNRRLYRYNVQTDTWQLASAQPQNLASAAVVAAPISAYGVTMFMSCGSLSGTCDGRLFIYKHATGSAVGITPDNQPPTVPTGLTASAVSSSQINLTWNAAADNVGVAGYHVYRDGVQVGTTSSTSYSSTGLLPSTSYSFTVAAYDGAGNLSAQSAPASGTTLSAITGNILGYATIGSTTDTNNSNFLNAFRFQMPNTNGSATSMSVYVTGPVSPAPNNQYQLAIYSDNNGLPGSLIASTQSGILVPNSWNTMPISATLNANTAYWLVYNSNGTSSTQNNLSLDPGATGQFQWKAATFGTWPSNFGTPGGSSASQASIYVTYTVTGTTPGGDTTPPTVSLTSPISGATISGTVSVAANAADNVGVAGVQFKLNGVNLGAEITAPPYILSWNTTSVVNGMHVLSAVARDAAGNQTSAQNVSVTVSNGTTIISPDADADFKARCSAPGVVKCWGFDNTTTDIVPNVNLRAAADGNYYGGLDTTIKASGAGSLRFRLPAGKAFANIAGQWLPGTNNLAMGGTTFGQNSEFYVQYRVRFSPEMFSNLAYWNSWWKQSIFHMNLQSCGGIEITTNYRNFTSPTDKVPNFYTECGQRGFVTDPVTGKHKYDGSPPYAQQQGDYNGLCNYPDWSRCWKYTADEWITFYYHFKIGTWNVNNSRAEVWVSRPSSKNGAYEKIIDIPDMTFTCNNNCSATSSEGYNNISLTPYMTGLSTPAPVDAYIWYDELIISTQPIAAPRAGGSTPTPQPPVAPSNLVLQ